MVMFHCYVSSPEGTSHVTVSSWAANACWPPPVAAMVDKGVIWTYPHPLVLSFPSKKRPGSQNERQHTTWTTPKMDRNGSKSEFLTGFEPYRPYPGLKMGYPQKKSQRFIMFPIKNRCLKQCPIIGRHQAPSCPWSDASKSPCTWGAPSPPSSISPHTAASSSWPFLSQASWTSWSTQDSASAAWCPEKKTLLEVGWGWMIGWSWMKLDEVGWSWDVVSAKKVDHPEMPRLSVVVLL